MEVVLKSLGQVWETFREVWSYLFLSVFISAAMRRYVSGERINRWLQKYRSTSIIAATGLAISTPLCSCGGGIAVALSMMAASIPWGPLMAFVIASPLTSPDEVLYSAGLFGWPFALTYVLAAGCAGIAGGFLTNFLEGKGWFANQARFKAKPVSSCCTESESEQDSCCSIERTSLLLKSKQGKRLKGIEYLGEVWLVGHRLLLTFFIASFLGYAFGNVIPAAWISSLFGADKEWSVPLAATLGIPLYLNISSSLPILMFRQK